MLGGKGDQVREDRYAESGVGAQLDPATRSGKISTRCRSLRRRFSLSNEEASSMRMSAVPSRAMTCNEVDPAYATRTAILSPRLTSTRVEHARESSPRGERATNHL